MRHHFVTIEIGAEQADLAGELETGIPARPAFHELADLIPGMFLRIICNLPIVGPWPRDWNMACYGALAPSKARCRSRSGTCISKSDRP